MTKEGVFRRCDSTKSPNVSEGKEAHFLGFNIFTGDMIRGRLRYGPNFDSAWTSKVFRNGRTIVNALDVREHPAHTPNRYKLRGFEFITLSRIAMVSKEKRESTRLYRITQYLTEVVRLRI